MLSIPILHSESSSEKLLFSIDGERFMTGQGAKNKRLQISQSWKGPLFHPSSFQSTEIIEEAGTERVYEPDAVCDYKENNVFQTQHDSSTYKPTVIMLAWTRPVQPQSKLNPSMGREHGQEVLSLAKRLLAFSSIWEESQFSLRVLSLLNWPHSGWRPHIQEYVLITNWVLEVGGVGGRT